MALKKQYTCDICSEQIKNVYEDGVGVVFSSLTDFKLKSANETEGKHICKRCLKILCSELKKPLVIEFLSEDTEDGTDT